MKPTDNPRPEPKYYCSDCKKERKIPVGKTPVGSICNECLVKVENKLRREAEDRKGVIPIT
jgi:hypothetical protein